MSVLGTQSRGELKGFLKGVKLKSYCRGSELWFGYIYIGLGMCWVCMICVLASAGMCTCMWVWRPKINIQCLLQVGVCVRACVCMYPCRSLSERKDHSLGRLAAMNFRDLSGSTGPIAVVYRSTQHLWLFTWVPGSWGSEPRSWCLWHTAVTSQTKPLLSSLSSFITEVDIELK